MDSLERCAIRRQRDGVDVDRFLDGDHVRDEVVGSSLITAPERHEAIPVGDKDSMTRGTRLARRCAHDPNRYPDRLPVRWSSTLEAVHVGNHDLTEAEPRGKDSIRDGLLGDSGQVGTGQDQAELTCCQRARPEHRQ